MVGAIAKRKAWTMCDCELYSKVAEASARCLGSHVQGTVGQIGQGTLGYKQ